MVRTDTFRAQHEDLVNMVKKINLALNPSQLAQDAGEVRRLLSQLAGKLKLHLAMEDKHLYPVLMNSADDGVKTTAKRYAGEMGSLASAFTSYSSKWLAPSAIQQNAAVFIEETRRVFDALGKRIQREDAELYVLADKAAQAGG